jgi:hypothetical protein
LRAKGAGCPGDGARVGGGLPRRHGRQTGAAASWAQASMVRSVGERTR